MLFGLCNAPASFQRLMNKVFVDKIVRFIALCLDDILIFISKFRRALETLAVGIGIVQEGQAVWATSQM